MTVDPPFIDLPSPITHLLERRRVGVTTASSFEFSEDRDAIRDKLLYRLSAFVLAEKLADDTHTATEQVPASWWQHWKRDHRSAWWFRWSPCRWLRPPRMTALTLSVRWERWATRPEANIAVPDSLGPVVYQEMVSPMLRWDQP